MNTSAARHPGNDALSRILGPVREIRVEGVDVYVAGTGDLIASGAQVTIRQATGIPGWVGIIDTDLTEYADIKLELRRPATSTECAVLFTVGGGLPDRTLIRGTTRQFVPPE